MKRVALATLVILVSGPIHSPNSTCVYAHANAGGDESTSSPPAVRELGITLETKSFSPDLNQALTFHLTGGAAPSRVYTTCRIHSISGKLIRVLYENLQRTVPALAGADPADRWDGRDGSGEVVPGGIYVISLAWGSDPGKLDGTDRAAVAVVR